MQNPSVFLYGPGDARIEDHPVPVLKDEHDVIVRIAYVGVCGSDVSVPSAPIQARYIYLVDPPVPLGVLALPQPTGS